MEKFTTLKAIAAIMDRANIDTDLIIPKQFLTRIERTGFGQFLFNNIRYDEKGTPKNDFILNQPRYKDAKILVARENFGCGSSREHAPWALLDYGFKCIISPKFADIFKNNSFKNGLLLIELENDKVNQLIKEIEATENYQLQIDLENQLVTGDNNFKASFDIDPFKKKMLLNGWDDISLTLNKTALIDAYEKNNNEIWQANCQQPSL